MRPIKKKRSPRPTRSIGEPASWWLSRPATAPSGGEVTIPAQFRETMTETIALTSPSGRMSKRARDAANERLRVELFGINGLTFPQCAQRPERERLLREAAELREYAARGLKPGVHLKRAAELEAMAADIP